MQTPPTFPSGFYGRGADYSVSGSRPEGQAFLLDNTNVQNFWNHGPGSAVLGTTLGVEAIAEFSTQTNTYSAQFGGAGAAVNAVTKSGTNSFHGSLFEYLRNSALDARALSTTDLSCRLSAGTNSEAVWADQSSKTKRSSSLTMKGCGIARA